MDRKLFSEMYKAFNDRDMEAVLGVLHPDVEWPNGWEGGYVYGRSGVRDYWSRQWAAINPHVEPVGFDADEAGNTIVNVHQVVRDQEGKVMVDEMVKHIYTVEDGLIKRMEISK